MTADNLAIMELAAYKMHYAEARQKQLAGNVSSADVPGYRARDLAAPDFKKLLANSTSTMSLASAGGSSLSGASNSTATKKQKFTVTTAPYAGVSLDEQLLKMSEAYTDHRMSSTIYQKNVDMLEKATK